MLPCSVAGSLSSRGLAGNHLASSIMAIAPGALSCFFSSLCFLSGHSMKFNALVPSSFEVPGKESLDEYIQISTQASWQPWEEFRRRPRSEVGPRFDRRKLRGAMYWRFGGFLCRTLGANSSWGARGSKRDVWRFEVSCLLMVLNGQSSWNLEVGSPDARVTVDSGQLCVVSD